MLYFEYKNIRRGFGWSFIIGLAIISAITYFFDIKPWWALPLLFLLASIYEVVCLIYFYFLSKDVVD